MVLASNFLFIYINIYLYKYLRQTFMPIQHKKTHYFHCFNWHTYMTVIYCKMNNSFNKKKPWLIFYEIVHHPD